MKTRRALSIFSGLAFLCANTPAVAEYGGGYSYAVSGGASPSPSLGARTIYAADPAYGVVCDGSTNNDAALAAISAATTAGGFNIVFPNSGASCKYTTWDFSSRTNVRVQGGAGLSLNTPAATGTALECTRTDGATCWNVQNTKGLVVSGMTIVKADSHTGIVVDNSSSASTWAKNKFVNVEWRRASGTARNGTALYVRNTVDVHLDTVRISHAANGIVGGFDGETTTGSAVLKCNVCDLVDLTVAVRNPGPFWTFVGGAWEQTLTNAPVTLLSQATDTVKAIGFYGVVFADATAAGRWMTFNGGVWGFTMVGGSMSGVAATDGILFAGAAAGTQGVNISGVNFAGMGTVITFTGTCAATSITGNVFTTVTNRVVNASGSCYTSNWWAANAPGSFNNALSGSIYNGQAGADPIWTHTPALGLAGTATGSLGFRGTTSGTATITAQAAAGTPTLLLPNASGTFAVTAAAPLALNATTGALTCPTCASGLTIGTTTIAGGTNTRVLFDNAGVVGEYTISGTGNVAMTTNPAFTTPGLGVATATSINKVAFTAPATGSTLTIADGKTLTANNSLTLAGTDGTTMTFPSVSASIPGLAVANTFTANQLVALSQNAQTQLTVNNSNVGASAKATLGVSTNAGTWEATSASTAGGSGMGFTWTGSGAMSFNATAATLTFSTNSFTTAITVSTAQLLRFHAYGAGTLTTDASGNVTATSDARLKSLRGDFEGGIAELRAIGRPKLYAWLTDMREHPDAINIGFIAQDVRRGLPQAVGRDSAGMLTLNRDGLLAATINGVLALDDRLVRLEQRMQRAGLQR